MDSHSATTHKATKIEEDVLRRPLPPDKRWSDPRCFHFSSLPFMSAINVSEFIQALPNPI